MSAQFPGVLLCLLLGCTLQADPAQGPGESQPEPELGARLVSSRPSVRPGEWFPVIFLVEPTDEGSAFLGPPDDGLRAPEGEPDYDTRLNWKTTEGEAFRLVPDLAAIQWPRTRKLAGFKRGVLATPVRIYVPVKVVPDTPIGTAQIEFELVGMLAEGGSEDFEEASPIRLARTVTVQVVHPTDPVATDVSSVDPTLFFGWRGDLPDWSVHDTRVTRSKKSAPLLAWIVVVVPVALVLIAIIWLFATRRL